MVLKRFWKLFLLLIIIMAVLITYFVHTSIVIANQFPELEIKTIRGDESVMDNVSVYGDFYKSDNYSSSLTVSLEGSTYYGELSFFEKLEPIFPPNEAIKIKDRHRNFMRGKMYNPASFFENDNYLAYVNAEISDWSKNNLPQYYLDVEVLDKKTKKLHSFQTKLPGVEEVYIDVLDITMVNEKLNAVLSLNYLLNGLYVGEIKVYTMDIISEEIVGDQTLFDPKEQNNGEKWTNLTFLNDSSEVDAGKYLLILKDINQDQETDQSDEGSEGARFELLERTLFVYDLEKKQLQELSLTEKLRGELLSNELRIDGFVNDTHANIAYLKEDNLIVLRYSLENLEFDLKQTFNLKELGIKNYGLKIKDNKMYIVEMTEGGEKSAKLFVADSLTGKILYEGEIVVKNEKGKKGDYYLQFHTLIMN